ncbi:hypothetical protein STBA_51770 [Streptomyces sp. MP131-18]|nr:hypothetical protein STBA_51770 [Streptomyces sp. MP131-18]
MPWAAEREEVIPMARIRSSSLIPRPVGPAGPAGYRNGPGADGRHTVATDGSPDSGTPPAQGATQDLPSGDPGSGNYWINDDGRSSGDGTVTYQGTWNSGSGCAARCLWSDDHWSDQAGNTATFRFTGTGTALLSVQDTGNGIAAISVHGGPEERVDFHGPIRTGETLQYLSPRLPYGEHTLQIRVTGEHNPEPGAAFVSVDRAEVYTD